MNLRDLPKRVSLLVVLHDAWIVGGAADPEATVSSVKDFDVMVPWKNWPHAAAMIPEDAKKTSLGGWRWQLEDGFQMDVWPDTLDRLASMDYFEAAWHPATGIRLQRIRPE